MDDDENNGRKESDSNVEGLTKDNKIGNANRDDLQQADSHHSTAPLQPKRPNITGEILERSSKKLLQKKLTSDGESETEEAVTEDNSNEPKKLNITGESLEHNLKKFLQKKLLSDGESDIEEVIKDNTNKQPRTHLSDIESDDDDIAINRNSKSKTSRKLVSSDSEDDNLSNEQNMKKKRNKQSMLVSDSGLNVSDSEAEDDSTLQNNLGEDLNVKCYEQRKSASDCGIIGSDGEVDNSTLQDNLDDINAKCKEQSQLASDSGLTVSDEEKNNSTLQDNLGEDLNAKNSEDSNPSEESSVNDQGERKNKKKFRVSKQDSFECTSETNRLFRGQKTVLPRNTVPSMNFLEFWENKKQMLSSERVIEDTFEASSSINQDFGPSTSTETCIAQSPDLDDLEVVMSNREPCRLQPFKMWNQNQSNANSTMNAGSSLSQKNINYKAKLLEAINKKKEQAFERQLQVQQEDEELVLGDNEEDLSDVEFSGDEDEESSGDESGKFSGDEGEITGNSSKDIEKMDESPDMSEEEKDQNKDSSNSSEDVEKMDESPDVSDEKKPSSEDYELSDEEELVEDDNFSSSYIPSYQPGGGFTNNINATQDTLSFTEYSQSKDTSTNNNSNEQLTDSVYYKAGASYLPEESQEFIPHDDLLEDTREFIPHDDLLEETREFIPHDDLLEESRGFIPHDDLLEESHEFIPHDDLLQDSEKNSTLFKNNTYPLSYNNLMQEFHTRRGDPSIKDVLPFCSGTFPDDACQVSSTQDEKKDELSPEYCDENYKVSPDFNEEGDDADQVSSTQGDKNKKGESSSEEDDIRINNVKRRIKRKKCIISDYDDSDDEIECTANASDKVDICSSYEFENQENGVDEQELHSAKRRIRKRKESCSEDEDSDNEERYKSDRTANISNKVKICSDDELEQESDVDKQDAHTIEQYFDNEAELSGEDVSEDENVEDGEYAIEDDDVTLPSDEKMRSEIGCLVAKQMIDDDTHAVKLLKEQFLEHGDLYSDDPGRSRKFTWYNKDEENVKNDSNDDLSDTENDLIVEDTFTELQKEKLKWKNEQPGEEDVLELKEFLKIKKPQLKLDIIGNKDSIKRISIDPLEISCNPGPSGIPNTSTKRKRTSVVLSQTSVYENALKKLKGSECDTSGSITTKHFVFSNTEEKKNSSKSPTVSAPKLALKQKSLIKSPDDNASKSPGGNNSKSSIFKHL